MLIFRYIRWFIEIFFLINLLTFLPSVLVSIALNSGWNLIGHDGHSSAADYPAVIHSEFSGLEQLVQDTAFLSSLSHDLTIGYIAIEDLLKIVKSSSLDGGDVLAEHLAVLREDAKTTAYGLQELQVKVDGVIDRVFAVNQVLMKALEQMSSTSTMQTVICTVIRKIPFLSSPCVFLQHLPMLFQNFIESLEAVVTSLITRTHALGGDIRRMEERLAIIRDVASGEAKIRIGEKAELLTDLWTLFGGNRKHLAMIKRDLQSLRILYEYHSLADQCVASALTELGGMRKALEDLRPLASRALLLESDSVMEAVMEQLRLGGERVRRRQAEFGETRMANTTSTRHVLLSSQVFDD